MLRRREIVEAQHRDLALGPRRTEMEEGREERTGTISLMASIYSADTRTGKVHTRWLYLVNSFLEYRRWYMHSARGHPWGCSHFDTHCKYQWTTLEKDTRVQANPHAAGTTPTTSGSPGDGSSGHGDEIKQRDPLPSKQAIGASRKLFVVDFWTTVVDPL